MPVPTKEQLQKDYNALKKEYDKLKLANQKAFDDAKAWAEKEIAKGKELWGKEKAELQSNIADVKEAAKHEINIYKNAIEEIEAKPKKERRNYLIAIGVLLIGLAILGIITANGFKNSVPYDNSNDKKLEKELNIIRDSLVEIRKQKTVDSIKAEEARIEAENAKQAANKIQNNFDLLLENNKQKRYENHNAIDNATDDELIRRGSKYKDYN